MKLPNSDRAIVEIAKLRDYYLDPLHPFGKHKARVFRAALGLGMADAGWLRKRLLNAAGSEAECLGTTKFGTLYMIEFELRTTVGGAVLRSGWIVRSGEDFPPLTTVYVKRNPR